MTTLVCERCPSFRAAFRTPADPQHVAQAQGRYKVKQACRNAADSLKASLLKWSN